MAGPSAGELDRSDCDPQSGLSGALAAVAAGAPEPRDPQCVAVAVRAQYVATGEALATGLRQGN